MWWQAVFLEVISGVPQGTIIKPILFLLYVNDLPDQAHAMAKMFADDTKLYESLRPLRDCAALQADLESFEVWMRDWLITFNKDKCVILRIRKSLQFTYFIDGHPLQEVSEHKDLGITVSSDLKPSKHFVTICKKANQRLGMINRCFANHSRSVISLLYKSIVCPIIENCSPIWNPCFQRDIDMLDKV